MNNYTSLQIRAAFAIRFATCSCTAFAICWHIIRPSHFEKASLFLSVWLSPNCPLVKKRLIQASLHRLFLLLSGLDSMLQHLFNKYAIPSRRVIYQHMCDRAYYLPILYDRAAAHSLHNATCFFQQFHICDL